VVAIVKGSIPFLVPTRDRKRTVLGEYPVAFVPGCFDESIRWRIVRLAANHNAAYLAIQADGSLDVRSDGRELSFTAVVEDERWAPWASILHAAARNGVLRGCSMSWEPKPRASQEPFEASVINGVTWITRVPLSEVSVMFGADNTPAIRGTYVGVFEPEARHA
jgi:hypothetical protein